MATAVRGAAAPGKRDWGGRETTLSYDGNGSLNKVVGPSLCVAYFDYDANDDLSALTDPEGRTLYYEYPCLCQVVCGERGDSLLSLTKRS